MTRVVPLIASATRASPELAAALKDCRRAFRSLALFSGVVNVLMLTGPLYMLQVYDRVLSSRSIPTLIALSILLVVAFAFQGALDAVRSRIVTRAATLLDRRLSTSIHAAVVNLAIKSRRAGDANQPVRDLDQMRAFLTSTGPTAIVDLPWMPIFLVICFLIHPWLGLASVAGAAALLTVTWLTARASRDPTRTVAQDSGRRAVMLEATRRNSESVVAMGMTDVLAQRWEQVNNHFVEAAGRLGDVVNAYSSLSKVLRMLLQSGILGLGAYLVIKQEITAGAMIAASIMMGRALAPIEIAIGNWRGFVSARDSLRRLSQTLNDVQTTSEKTELPNPQHSLEVENVTAGAPGSETPIIRDMRFRLNGGEALGIIGPSGAGKTSLVRTIVGVWRPMRGVVRIDGAALDQWDPSTLGKHVGFVSQGVELFDATIAENIARMSIANDSTAVVHAARAAGVHDMILRLPGGYDSRIGEAGMILSAGQRQRIALARAFYGDPFLIVLDEPNSNLDTEGEAALLQAIQNAKARRAIVIIIAHRPSILVACDKVLLMANGLQQAFGPRNEILSKIVSYNAPASPAAVSLKVAGDPVRGADR